MPETYIRFERELSSPNEVFSSGGDAFSHYAPVLEEMNHMGPEEWGRGVRRAHGRMLEKQREVGIGGEDKGHPTDYVPRRWRALGISMAAPLMVPVTITVWISLVALGYALIYYAGMDGMTFSFSTSGLEPSFIEALYFSGASISTLGLGTLITYLEERFLSETLGEAPEPVPLETFQSALERDEEPSDAWLGRFLQIESHMRDLPGSKTPRTPKRPTIVTGVGSPSPTATGSSSRRPPGTSATSSPVNQASGCTEGR